MGLVKTSNSNPIAVTVATANDVFEKTFKEIYNLGYDLGKKRGEMRGLKESIIILSDILLEINKFESFIEVINSKIEEIESGK